LRSHGFKAFRDSASGGSTHKSDIVNGLDYSMEVKTVKKLNLKECWRQVTRDSSIAHNSPLLAIHLDGMPENEWIIGLHSNDWVELEKTARQKPKIEDNRAETHQYDRNTIYALQQLKSQINRVSKLLEDENQ